MRTVCHVATRRFAKHVSISSDCISNALMLICIIKGHSTLPSSCPVCEHSPVSAADCKPNKSLRTTIKVFLRTEEKKREARLKEAKKHTPPATPSEPITSPKQDELKAEAAVTDISVPAAPAVEDSEAPQSITKDTEIQQQADQDIPQPSIEVSGSSLLVLRSF